MILLLVDSAVKVSLVVLLALAAAMLLRRRSAAARHWVLSAALACAVLMPVLTLVVPSWSVRLPSSTAGRLAAPPTPSRSILVATSGSIARSVQQERPGSTRYVSAATMLAVIWLAGVGAALLILCVGLARLVWLAAGSERILDGPWMDIGREISARYSLRRFPQLLLSDHPTLLVTWGILAPKVILPKAARTWTSERARIVLAHELAHIQRRDWVTHMMAEILRAVYWFNPIVWIACRRVRQESEYACDDAVLGLGVDGAEYATHLVELARAFNANRVWLPAPAIASPSNLERRVSVMLNTHLNRNPVPRSARTMIVIALLGITVAVAGAQAALATVSGSIIDQVGRILPGATLTLTNVRDKTTYQIHGDDNGGFTLGGLPAGDYTIEARITGFAESQGKLTLAAGQNLKRDIALQVGSLHETISVKGGGNNGGTNTARPAVQSATIRDSAPCQAPATGGNIEAPLKLRHVQPDYSLSLQEAGIQGTVLLEGRIGTDGLVKDLRLAAPVDPGLAQAAIDAVSEWRFSQTRLDCVPVEVPLGIRVTFSK